MRAIKFHTNNGTYNIKLRACYNFSSEKMFRAAVEKSIDGQPEAVKNSLSKKWNTGNEFEVLRYFGMITWKEKVS